MIYKQNKSCQIQHWDTLATSLFGGKEYGNFVEVGAYDGREWSNTDFLADAGWRGIYIEANREYAERCALNHAKNNVTVLNCACGDDNALVPFYTSTGISHTIDQATAARVDPWHDAAERYSTEIFSWVRCFRLETLLNTLMFPQKFDLLVIDVEGAELQVLQGIDLYRYRPHVIIVEVHSDDPKSKSVMDMIVAQGYPLIRNDGLNAIFVEAA